MGGQTRRKGNSLEVLAEQSEERCEGMEGGREQEGLRDARGMREGWAEICAPRGLQVEIRSSEVTRVIGEYALGRGLFACQDFAVNEIITVYGGELISAEEARWMPSPAHLPLLSSCTAWCPKLSTLPCGSAPSPPFLVRLQCSVCEL